MPPRSRRRSVGSASTVPAASSVSRKVYARRGAKGVPRGIRDGGVRKENVLKNRQIKKANLVHWSRVCRPGTSCNRMTKSNIERDLRQILDNPSDPVLAAKLEGEIRSFLADPDKSRADRVLGNQFAAAGLDAEVNGAGGASQTKLPTITATLPTITASVLGGLGYVTMGGGSIEGAQILELAEYLKDAIVEKSGWVTHPQTKFAGWVLMNILAIYEMWNARAAAKSAGNTQEANRVTRGMIRIISTLVKRVIWIASNYMAFRRYKASIIQLPSVFAKTLSNLYTNLARPASSTLPIPLNARQLNYVVNGIRSRRMSAYAPPSMGVTGAGRVAMRTLRKYGGTALGGMRTALSISTANPVTSSLVVCIATVIAALVLTGSINLPKRGNIKSAVTRGAKRARNAAMEEIRNAAAAFTR